MPPRLNFGLGEHTGRQQPRNNKGAKAPLLFRKKNQCAAKFVLATADMAAISQAVIGLALKQGGYLNLLRKRLKGLRCHHRFLSAFPFDPPEIEPSYPSATASSG